MKTNTLLLLQAVAAVVSAAPTANIGVTESSEVLKIAHGAGYPVKLSAIVREKTAYESGTALARSVSQGENMPAAFQTIPAQTKITGTKRVKIRSGPYTMPSTAEKNMQSVLEGVPGMIDSVKSLQKPCTSCKVVEMIAGLEYANGSDANTDTGSWLHHIVLFNSGPGSSDAACGSPGIDPFFSSGNERSIAYFTDSNLTQATGGLTVKPSDVYTIYSELMNMDAYPKDVYITVEYEFLPEPHPELKESRAIWIELNQCGKADTTTGNLNMEQRPQKQSFVESSAPLSARYNGDMISVAGHLHDGGTQAVIFHNGKVLCDSVASYGGGGYNTQQGATTSMSGMVPTQHISYMMPCSMLGPMKKGDTFHINAQYNFTAHAGMKTTSGQLDEIMGISILYTLVDPSELRTTS